MNLRKDHSQNLIVPRTKHKSYLEHPLIIPSGQSRLVVLSFLADDRYTGLEPGILRGRAFTTVQVYHLIQLDDAKANRGGPVYCRRNRKPIIPKSAWGVDGIVDGILAQSVLHSRGHVVFPDYVESPRTWYPANELMLLRKCQSA